MYENLDKDEMKYLKFVAANPETCTVPDDVDVIKEWELPIYDPELQQKNWWIGGVVHHIVANKICKTKYMGFAQHDFRFTKGSVKNLVSMMKPGLGVCLRSMDYRQLVNTSTFGMHEMSLYTYALTQLPKLTLDKFPIYHSCFMETKLYESIIERLLQVDKFLYQFHDRPGDPIYRFAITSERTLALAIGGVLKEILEVKDIIHEEKIE